MVALADFQMDPNDEFELDSDENVCGGGLTKERFVTSGTSLLI